MSNFIFQVHFFPFLCLNFPTFLHKTLILVDVVHKQPLTTSFGRVLAFAQLIKALNQPAPNLAFFSSENLWEITFLESVGQLPGFLSKSLLHTLFVSVYSQQQIPSLEEHLRELLSEPVCIPRESPFPLHEDLQRAF